jgi:hypothetical protein
VNKKLWGIFAFTILMGGTALAQGVAPGYIDPRPVLESVAKNTGADKLKCITYSGTGYVGGVGQNRRPMDDWPEISVPTYSRTINFETGTSREELIRIQSTDPDLVTERTLVGTGVGERVQTAPREEETSAKHTNTKGGTTQGALKQVLLTNGKYAWNLVGKNVVPEPAAAEQRQLDILLTPWGFLKAAMASDKVTAHERYEEGRKTIVVSAILMGKYRVNATINPAFNHIERIQTWVPDPVLGDMRYDHYYRKYKEFGGVQFPTGFHHHYGPDDELRTPRWFNGYNAFGIDMTSVQPNVCGDVLDVPDAVRTATIPPVRVETKKLADGVWFLGGASHNSVAVEFKDFVTVVEAPLNEERSIAVMEEVKKLVPNKRIKYVVATHNHLVNLGGIRTYAEAGATIVAHEFIRDFLWHVVLNWDPWTLKPDRLSLTPPEEILDTGFIFESVNEKITLSDGTRNMDVYHVYGATTRNCRDITPPEGCSMELEESPYMLMTWLPKEKILVEAGLYNPDVPEAIPGNGERAMYNNVKRYGLDVATIAPVHGQPVPWSDFVKFIGKMADYQWNFNK